MDRPQGLEMTPPAEARPAHACRASSWAPRAGCADRTLYAIERGEQVPRLDFYLAALAALEAEPDYFKPAVRADVAERL